MIAALREYETVGPQCARTVVKAESRLIRLAWMIGRVYATCGRPIRLRDYQAEWRCSRRSFWRDIALLREAGIQAAGTEK